MAPALGLSSLFLVFSVAIFLPFFVFFSWKKIAPTELEKISQRLVALILAASLFSQLCLIYSFLISDYSVTNVYKNSHHLKPLIYKISGSWGNHEGSMLLLITTLSAYTVGFGFLSKSNAKEKLITLSTQSAIISLFAAFTAFTSNPFARIFPTPANGLGLNPLLQDIGLALHPPILYTGYIGFSLVFSLIIAGLLLEKICPFHPKQSISDEEVLSKNHGQNSTVLGGMGIDRDFVRRMQVWLFFSYGFLTLGIGLGAWWAYRELGWGGYWFWDPVENISLMPWLAATALIHAAKLVERKEIYQNWTAFLAILTFILCLLGIFLTRSGVLSSVHSFAIDAGRGFFILALIFLIGGGGMLVFGYKAKGGRRKAEGDWLILANNYFLLIALFTVLLGTTYPLFLRGLFGEFISIGASYYNKIFAILIVPFLLLIAYSTKSLRPTPKNLAHLGFFLIILGICSSSYFGITKELNLKQGESFTLGKYQIRFVKTEYFAGKNFLTRQGDFVVTKNGDEVVTLQPQLRYYPVNDQTTNEAAINHGFFGDLYLVIGNKDEQENYALRAYYKPMIWLIWLGCFLVFFASIQKIFRKGASKN
ncbi:MAG: heme lyase CcmF/NrfE family subunit [Alphaproteobacteria bacterium]|nr:heme lyase CcmF/NrfE family subunit [Alphaproteobacteria bacterium]